MLGLFLRWTSKTIFQRRPKKKFFKDQRVVEAMCLGPCTSLCSSTKVSTIFGQLPKVNFPSLKNFSRPTHKKKVFLSKQTVNDPCSSHFMGSLNWNEDHSIVLFRVSRELTFVGTGRSSFLWEMISTLWIPSDLGVEFLRKSILRTNGQYFIKIHVRWHERHCITDRKL